MAKLRYIAAFILISTVTFAQTNKRITGKVLDAQTHTPLSGVSVLVEDLSVGENTGVPNQIRQTAVGTVTDISGKFSLTVPAGVNWLSVTYLGYETQRAAISSDSLHISLVPAQQSLSEVIVTGYGDIKRRKNTGAYNKVGIDKIRQTAVSGVDQLLEGQVAGLQLSNFNGGPNTAPKIRIRGTVSLNGTQDPLWVVDGLPLEGTALPNNIIEKDNINNLQNFPIAGINPDDIADITVLKDAAATSIYGARAANGVIVITTKNGKSGPARINVQANTFFSQSPDVNKLNLMNATEKIDWELQMADRKDLTYRADKGEIARILASQNGQQAQDAIAQLRQTNTNWGKELYRNTLNQQYTASISGGSDRNDYYLSAGYYDEKGATKGVDMNRYSLTLKTNIQLSNQLKAGLSILGSTSKRNNFIQDADAFSNPSYYLRTVNPYLTVRDATGNFVYDPDIEGYSKDTYVPFNAVEERKNTHYDLDNRSVKSLAYLQYQVLPSLQLHTELGLQFEDTGTERFGDQASYYTRKIRERSRYYDRDTKTYDYFLPQGGVIENFNSRDIQYNWKSFAHYVHTFVQKHELDLTAGTELRRTNSTGINSKGFGYNPETLTTQNIVFPNNDFANDKTFSPYTKTRNETSYASFFALGSYSYDQRYTLYGSLRYDGSNMFGVDPKYRYLPIWSISGAWNAIQESFMQHVGWLSDLKVRLSYGLQGNVDRNTYPFVVGQYGNESILPGGNETSIVVSSPPNDKLRWERTATIDAGLDLGLFHNAVQITADYYHRSSRDLVDLSPLPLETGFEFVTRNWARVKNEGIELTISTRNISHAHFSWSTDFNIAHNNNRLTQVQQDPNIYDPGKQVGYPLNGLFVLQTAGLDADGLPLFVNKQGQAVSYEDFYGLKDPYADFLPGYLVESNLDAKAYQNLFTYKGSMDPKFSGGLINRFGYHQFDLTVSAVFNLNQWRRRSVPYNPATVDRGVNQVRDILNAYSPSNPGGNLPAIGSTSIDVTNRWMAYSWLSDNDPGTSYNDLDIWTKEISFIRINSIRLGYTLPSRISGKIKAASLRFNVEARNLLVFGSNYDGYFDPETYGDPYAQPLARSISFGLSASF
ncbi:TonB-linked outer membrane protein, SusC/RagA family [bacterium A37T11]|nr:TonB-linked outer membrane protein, SusC/RagA family [bacterium A37T11]